MILKGRLVRKSGLFIAFLLLTAVSCRKEAGKNYEYLVSDNFEVSFKTGNISYLLDIAAGSYPDLAELKPFISSDVKVYKIVYKTVVDNESINASGLVCVPVTAGEYPVLCFQNGTNTLNAYSPSEYPLNPTYEMVEVVASLGYIVVIPDYPGFGESAQIPHPYLIAEPTVKSTTDMLFAANEFVDGELQDVTVKNEYYLMGYSQGGWATMALHKALEQDPLDEFNLRGSVCGAGPYNLTMLFNTVTSVSTYSMPVYIGYIVNAYSLYHQFTNPVSDIFNEQYASNLGSLYNGLLSSDQINAQLTTSIPGLFNADFLSGFGTNAKYSSVREALTENSISPWKTEVPLYLVHGGSDVSVNPLTTENIYNGMISAGTSAEIITKEILPGLDHGEGVVPSMVRGIKFIRGLQGLK